MSRAKPRICFVVSAPETASAFLNPHIAVLAEHYDIDVIANFDASAIPVSDLARHINLPIERTIKPLKDLKALLQLRKAFRAGEYASVHSVTPKAGLLAMTAAAAARTPVRIHWFTGQVWATRTGLGRTVLKTADRITARFATEVLIDSPSQRDFVVAEGVVPAAKAVVLGNGSICGVDAERFAPDPAARARLRAEFDVADDTTVLLFVGRINRDKGVLDLARALPMVQTDSRLCVVLAGSDEQDLIPGISAELESHGIACIYVGHTSTPEKLMAAADIFCMPSYREGFGLSVIEASACALPCVASNIYGLSDAVVDGVTGLLFPAGDAELLASCLERLVPDQELRSEFGAAGRQRVLQDFTQQELTSALLALYCELVPLLD